MEERRREDLKRALRGTTKVEAPSEPGSREEHLREVIEGSKWDPTKKENWRFRMGRSGWGFWLLTIAFALFMLTQYIIRPILEG
jgi:hypothetical protein